MQAEIQHIEHLQNERNFRFRIKPLGGSMGKIDRIRRLMRLFEQGGIVPPRLRFRTLDDKGTVNLVDAFVEKSTPPSQLRKTMTLLDCLARILDPDLQVRRPFSDWDPR